MFGICLGHQILGLAMGGETFKLKFGHRGSNHPVKHLETGQVEITSQNHGFAVDPESLPKDVEITHLNLYDNTVEGFRHRDASRVLRAVPPRGVARPARRGLPVPAVPRRDGERAPLRQPMPKRTDIKRVLVIGSGPIVIGQACEFDYSGTQACKALRAEGLEVVLVNSNPATIMTDPELADRTYVEPLTAGDCSTQIIERERPDALLPTVGGQTALNLAVDAGRERHAREVRREADRRVDRGDQGRGRSAAVPRRDDARSASTCRAAPCVAIARRGARSGRTTPGFPRSSVRRSRWAASAAASPTTSKSSARSSSAASSLSPVHEVLVEQSVIGWKEFELEVMRDAPTTSSSSARSRTSIRWACTPATASPSRRR